MRKRDASERDSKDNDEEGEGPGKEEDYYYDDDKQSGGHDAEEVIFDVEI